MRPLLPLVAACALLSGCNGVPTAFNQDPVYDQAILVHSGGPLPYLLMGTAVQWNEDYAVTVKHIPYVPGAVYQGQGDVQFFRHKANGVPVWRTYRPGEAVTAVGYNSLYMSVKGSGHALPAMVRLDTKEGNVMYGTHDGPTAKGMSGGPVFAEDGKVVGITVAFLTRSDLAAIKRPDLANQPRVSIFMPYAQIKREWNRYLAQAKPVASETSQVASR
ncbi:serine protease [Pseudomonas sp. GD03842]|uniref:trypsin-like peptidase domain-containing protein n=1 Tax=Pseudomonas sp. GD03842 TaxID=2975385 RepID=UPI002449906A|nr:trypsin-like peptidase domain-containing protein [Pseudomonas sp. GD03842]MDH0747154.1 serine protease [Pseudomonas sp. GD03842]